MKSPGSEPEPKHSEHQVGSFPVRPVPVDEWLGDAFYREDIGATGEPEGVIPQD